MLIKILSIPLGPRVLLTRSPMAMAPTKEERRAVSARSSSALCFMILMGLRETILTLGAWVALKSLKNTVNVLRNCHGHLSSATESRSRSTTHVTMNTSSGLSQTFLLSSQSAWNLLEQSRHSPALDSQLPFCACAEHSDRACLIPRNPHFILSYKILNCVFQLSRLICNIYCLTERGMGIFTYLFTNSKNYFTNTFMFNIYNNNMISYVTRC